MPVIINAKATSWGKKMTLAIISLIFLVIDDTLISIMISLCCQTSKQFRDMDYLEFREWKFPIEMALLCVIGSLTTCCIFGYAHIDITHEPAQNAGIFTAARSAELIEDEEEDDDDDDDNDYTTGVSEQLASADMGTRMDRDDTTVDTNARPPSPRDFLRRNSTELEWETETLV